MPSNVDPSIARGLAKIAQLQPQCGSRRMAVGNENAARGAEIDAAKVVEEADWLNLESVTRQAAAKVTDNSVYSRQADYRACLYAAEGRIKKAQPSTVQYTPTEARGEQIVAALDSRCMNQKTAAMRLYGSVAELVADNRVLYNAMSGSPARVSAFNANAARNAQSEPASADVYAYWSCLAQARLQQMDDGSASLRGGGRESGAQEPDRPGTVIASAPQSPYLKQSGDKNYLTEDGKPCITAQTLPTEVHDDGWKNYEIEYTNVCPRIIVIYSRTIQDGPRWNWDGVQSGGIGEGSKSKPAKMTAGCINDPKHKVNACAGYSEWWVK